MWKFWEQKLITIKMADNRIKIKEMKPPNMKKYSGGKLNFPNENINPLLKDEAYHVK